MLCDLAASGIAPPGRSAATGTASVDRDDYPARILQRHIAGAPAGQHRLGRRRRGDARTAPRRHRQAAHGGAEGRARRLDPGLHREDGMARLLHRHRSRAVDGAARAAASRCAGRSTNAGSTSTPIATAISPSTLWIDTVEQLIIEYPWLDHRHTVQHCQLTTAAQFRRMARLGMCANIFANHLWFWGDEHHDITVGPERARRMEPAATAEREGVSFSLHSDANVTPLGQLHTMWCAVNRVTPSGRVLGEHERISPHVGAAGGHARLGPPAPPRRRVRHDRVRQGRRLHRPRGRPADRRPDGDPRHRRVGHRRRRPPLPPPARPCARRPAHVDSRSGRAIESGRERIGRAARAPMAIEGGRHGRSWAIAGARRPATSHAAADDVGRRPSSPSLSVTQPLSRSTPAGSVVEERRRGRPDRAVGR